MRAIQDFYPNSTRTCYGCGPKNRDGYRIRSFREGEETVCRFTPEDVHTAVPGVVYGGLLACLVDCHGTAAAAEAAYRAEGRPMDSLPARRFVTGRLTVNYRRPTPLGVELVLRARAVEIGARKVRVAVKVEAGSVLTVEGEVLAVRIPERWLARLDGGNAAGANVAS